MTKDRSVYIRHIFDCIGRIKEYVSDGKEAFFRDRKTQQFAILRSSVRWSRIWAARH